MINHCLILSSFPNGRYFSDDKAPLAGKCRPSHTPLAVGRLGTLCSPTGHRHGSRGRGFPKVLLGAGLLPHSQIALAALRGGGKKGPSLQIHLSHPIIFAFSCVFLYRHVSFSFSKCFVDYFFSMLLISPRILFFSSVNWFWGFIVYRRKVLWLSIHDSVWVESVSTISGVVENSCSNEPSFCEQHLTTRCIMINHLTRTLQRRGVVCSGAVRFSARWLFHVGKRVAHFSLYSVPVFRLYQHRYHPPPVTKFNCCYFDFLTFFVNRYIVIHVQSSFNFVES